MSNEPLVHPFITCCTCHKCCKGQLHAVRMRAALLHIADFFDHEDLSNLAGSARWLIANDLRKAADPL